MHRQPVPRAAPALTAIPACHAAGDVERLGQPIRVTTVPSAASLSSPAPTAFLGSDNTTGTTAPLVWCGLAKTRCANAAGRICLIQVRAPAPWEKAAGQL
jgi:hypothetical protein